jgi:HK97 family phage major capsid protein
MSEISKKLFAGYRNDWEEAKALLATATDDKREFTPEEEERWTKLNNAMSDKKSKMDSVEQNEERAAKIDALAERALKVENAVKSDNDGDVLRAVALGEKRSAKFDIRALASGTATVPVSFADFLVIALTAGNPVYAGATKLRTATGEQITVPRLTANQAASFVGEGSQISPTDPTISSITLYANKIAALTLLSNELIRDNAVNITQLVGESAGNQIAFLAGSACTLGTGTTQPTGFVTAATNAQLSTATKAGTVASTFFDALDVIGLAYSLAPMYRLAATEWQISSTAMSKVRKLQDTTGQPIWTPGLVVGQPDTLLGFRVVENVHMAAVASASKSVAIIHTPSYIVRELPTEVASSTEFRFDYAQTAVRTLYGVDGNIPDVTAMRVLVSATT